MASSLHPCSPVVSFPGTFSPLIQKERFIAPRATRQRQSPFRSCNKVQQRGFLAIMDDDIYGDLEVSSSSSSNDDEKQRTEKLRSGGKRSRADE
ncbi:hypothetical protein BIW11_03926 [Tropilaelaps mercedesae]|uniref:Uncharacterized protein n=1 Tax=Tropilaelaps mercedesae TaxID=418985 RepID=A0A1V9XDN1_9ACAR|nr:hypothetical protein BIW11_03926 [Tropilaelaps mercedesae]